MKPDRQFSFRSGNPTRLFFGRCSVRRHCLHQFRQAVLDHHHSRAVADIVVRTAGLDAVAGRAEILEVRDRIGLLGLNAQH